MKQTIKFVAAVFLLSMLASCSDDSENKNTPEIARSWSLTYFSAGLAGVTTYEAGDIIWQFDSKNKLTVKFNVDLTGKMVPLITAGEHTYELQTDRIVLDDDRVYDYTIVDDGLTISGHPEVDGPELRFIGGKID
jgi:hypothetical protein